MALKLGVLISGSGTNLQAIIDRIANGSLDATVELVVSSRPNAYGLKRAEAAGIQTMTLSKELYAADPIAADQIMAGALAAAGVEYVAMAGYMRMVRAPMLAAFPNRVVNLHPALLPAFKGAHAIADAHAAGVKVTGVTVHFANDRYDCGPIIAQRAVTVGEGWSVEQLEAAIHAVEHELYPETLQAIAEGRVTVRADGTVSVAPAAGAAPASAVGETEPPAPAAGPAPAVAPSPTAASAAGETEPPAPAAGPAVAVAPSPTAAPAPTPTSQGASA